MRKPLSEIYKELCAQIPELDARIILKERANAEWSDIIADANREIECDEVLGDLNERLNGRPLSRIYGKREFWGMDFTVNEYTLDPRPDSETLIEAALGYYKGKTPPKTILDLGTGSGCLLLSLLKEFPDATGVGADISEGAIATASNNAKSLGLDARCQFQVSNWCESIDQKFDLIISNPPYIASKVIPNLEKEVKNHDPMAALDGGNDGLDAYHSIFFRLKHVLNDDGYALFEIGFDQADDMKRLSKKYEIRLGDIYPDLSGNPRVVEMFKK